MTIDIWLKRIWLVIGLVVLVACLVGAINFLVHYCSSHDRVSGPLVGPNAQPKGADSLVGQNISFDPPQPVGTTDWLFIGVRVRDLTTPLSANELKFSNASEYRFPYERSLINVIFTTRDGSVSYSLLDRKGLIKSIDMSSTMDSLQQYNVYDIAFLDTDHDGRITAQDSSQLYMSDVLGHDLVQVTPAGEVVQWHRHSPDHKRLFIATKRRPTVDDIPIADWPERLYIYDIRNRTLSRFPADDRTVERVQRQLWR
jgi:hypothetical protein